MKKTLAELRRMNEQRMQNLFSPSEQFTKAETIQDASWLAPAHWIISETGATLPVLHSLANRLVGSSPVVSVGVSGEWETYLTESEIVKRWRLI